MAYLSKNLQSISGESPATIHGKISEAYEELLNRKTVDDNEAKKKMHVKTVLGAARALTAIQSHKEGSVSTEEDSKNLDDVLMPWLDASQGSSVDAKDHTIFTKLTKRHELRFTEDMHALNVLDPDDITRVTEYGEYIVEFVAQIQKNGFAYQNSSGVYFDLEAFGKARNHYARLEPWNSGDISLQADGEGAISGKDMKKGDSEKRNQADFALWKLSKSGEPSWPSPWGDGRPGWHIECSAMASDKLGKQIDIHSGGIDLAFPHHDNELAQSEAYWTAGKQQHQWVNYFLHMGHLSIAGAKMSKSLKNFTTIRDALSSGAWTSRGLRIVLLLGSWKEGIEITDELVKASTSWEEKVNNFFLNAKDILDNAGLQNLRPDDAKAGPSLLQPLGEQPIESASPTEDNELSSSLDQALSQAKSDAYFALCDSFNTASVMNLISQLITIYNSASPPSPTSTTLEYARWITSMTNMFGLNGPASPTSHEIGWSGLDIPAFALPALTAISTLRDELRQAALSPSGITTADASTLLKRSEDAFTPSDPSAPFIDTLFQFRSALSSLSNPPNPSTPSNNDSISKPILALCDSIRDTHLFPRGIYLEDRDPPHTTALLRPVTLSMKLARAELQSKADARAAAKAAREAEERARLEKGRMKPQEMFKTAEYEGMFAKWDEDGVPTHEKGGGEVGKSKGKKLRKEWERQRKAHEGWLASLKAAEG